MEPERLRMHLHCQRHPFLPLSIPPELPSCKHNLPPVSGFDFGCTWSHLATLTLAWGRLWFHKWHMLWQQGCHKVKSRCVSSPMVPQKTILNFTRWWECENMGFFFSPLWVGFSKTIQRQGRGLIYIRVNLAHHFYPVLLSANKTPLSLTRVYLILRAAAAEQPVRPDECKGHRFSSWVLLSTQAEIQEINFLLSRQWKWSHSEQPERKQKY